MATGKPLEIIVDASLYELPEVSALIEKGHVVKHLRSEGYDIILGPKASNLTLEDIKKNPKLLDIAILSATNMKYPPQPKVVKSKSEAKRIVIQKGEPNGLDNQEAPVRPPEEALPAAAPKAKRKPRKPKSAVKGAVVEAGRGAGGEGPVNQDPNPTGDQPSGGQ